MENTTVNEGKTAAIISYLWWVGLIIAFLMNNSKKNSFASFHIRQMLGITLLSFIGIFLKAYVSGIFGWVVGAITVVLWIIGFLSALQGEEKRVPLLGNQFQDWFKNIG